MVLTDEPEQLATKLVVFVRYRNAREAMRAELRLLEQQEGRILELYFAREGIMNATEMETSVYLKSESLKEGA